MANNITYETTTSRFNEGIGLLTGEQITKLLVACQNAIKEQYPVAGSKDIFSKVHDKGEYGAYRLTIQQLVDAGWISPSAINYINQKLTDHPEGPEKLETRKSYFEYAKEYQYDDRTGGKYPALSTELDFAEAKIEAKNNAQYYFIANNLEGVATRVELNTGGDVLLSGFYQDQIAYDYLNFIYDLFLAARVITPTVDEKITAGLLSVALCVNYDTALSYANGLIKKDTTGITSKYWYDIGWNSIADKPLAVSAAKPDIPEVAPIAGAATSAERSIDKVKVEYSIAGQNISARILYDGIEIATSMPATLDSLTKQLDKVINAAKIVGPTEKYQILLNFNQQLNASYESDIAPIKKQLNITDPQIVAANDADGNTITTTVTTNPDGTKTTTVETVNAAGTIRTKETTSEKVILETKTPERDVTDPSPSEVPVAANDETVNSANSVDTYRATNLPFNTESLPSDQQDDSKGFKDPHKTYPLKTSINKPDTNPLATGVNSPAVAANPKTPSGDRESLSAGASPAARNATRKREVKTAGRNGATWAQPESPYAAQYPYNKVFGSEAGHAIEIDDSPGAERLNWAHRSGTFDEISPDGTKVTKIVGDGYTIFDKNGYILIEGVANVHVAGNCNVIIMSDTNLTMHGKVSMDIHNDVDVNIAGRLSLSVGEGIYARNGGMMSLDNVGDIDIDAKGNFTTDTVGKFNLTSESGVNVTSKADTHIKSAGSFFNHSTGDTNLCTDAAIKTKSGAATEIKSGAAVNVESTADTNIKSGGALNTEAAGNTSLKAAKVLSSDFNAPTIDVSTLNAASTNLRATGTDTGTNGGSTHNLPVAGSASVTVPASAGSATDAVCAEPAPISTVKTVEKPVSRSVAGKSQVVGRDSGGVGGGSSLPNDTSYDTEEESAQSGDCRNGVGTNDAGQVSNSDDTVSDQGGSGSGDISGPGTGKAPTTCNVYYKTKKPMPALAMSGRLTDDIRLSDNYVLRDIVHCVMAKRKVTDITPYRRGGKVIFGVWDIVQNYRCLFLNIVEPLREKYPGFVINSGWRPTDTAHGYAAVDLQWPKYMEDRKKMIEIAEWIAVKFPHDQILLERQDSKSNTAWIHLGYKRFDGQQRNEHYTVQSVPWKVLSKTKKQFVRW
jgi:hypothetical protein